MKMRHVFSTPSLDVANTALDAARQAGINDQDLYLVARSDIEQASVPNRHREADTDFMHGAVRGAGYGAVAGLVIGLITMFVTSIALGWIGVAAMTVAGAVMGAFGSALMGSALQDPIRVKFHDRIEAGEILVVVDGDADKLSAIEPAMTQAGAEPLPFDGTRAMS